MSDFPVKSEMSFVTVGELVAITEALRAFVYAAVGLVPAAMNSPEATDEALAQINKVDVQITDLLSRLNARIGKNS